MRILFVTPWFPSSVNPIAGVFVDRDAALVAEEHEVHVVHLADPALLTDEDLGVAHRTGFTVERIPWGRRSPGDLLAVRRRLRALIAGADVVHTQAFQSLLPLAGMRVSRPWVHSEHWSGIGDPASLPPRGRAVVGITAGLLGRPDVVTTVSSYLGDRVRTHRKGVVRVVPSVVQPPARLVQAPADPARIRLVAVGNLVDGKDPFLALETVRTLRRRGIDATLTWVGDGALRPSLVTESASDPGVEFVGARDATGVSTALEDADVFILPTRGETLCLAALEAITHGRPVVIGARGGQRDYISSANGRLVEERTPDAYADAVLEVRQRSLTPATIAASLGGAFSPEAVRAGYLAAYAEAAALRNQRR